MRWWWLVALAACDPDPTPSRGPWIPETPSTMAVAPPPALDIDEGMSGPEAVIHDDVADVYLVSNINGPPMARDDNGYIARLSPDGTVLAEKWIDGAHEDVTLHAPRGMAIRGDTLYVVDADALRLFDRATGVPRASWPIPDPKFPNDLRIAPDGSAIVTETAISLDSRGAQKDGTSTIWRFSPEGTPEVLMRDDRLEGPNGIVLRDGDIIVATFLGRHLLRIHDGQISELATLPAGQLDGLTALADGSLLVTSWESRSIYRVDPSGRVRTAFHATSLLGAASIAIDSRRGRVLIPLVLANQLRIEDVPP